MEEIKTKKCPIILERLQKKRERLTELTQVDNQNKEEVVNGAL